MSSKRHSVTVSFNEEEDAAQWFADMRQYGVFPWRAGLREMDALDIPGGGSAGMLIVTAEGGLPAVKHGPSEWLVEPVPNGRPAAEPVVAGKPKELTPTGRLPKPIRGTERAAEMKLLREQNGLTLQEVGDRFGLTRERVRQILDAVEVDNDAYKTARKAKRQIAKQRHAGAVMRLYNSDTRLRTTDIAERLGIAHTTVCEIVQDHTTADERRQRIFARAKGRDRQWSDDEMLAAIRLVARAIGRTPGLKAYDNARRALDTALPSGPTFLLRFGKWNTAVERAGFTPHKRPKGMGLAKYTDDDFRRAARRMKALLDRRPSLADWRQLKEPHEPTAESVRQRYGGYVDGMRELLP